MRHPKDPLEANLAQALEVALRQVQVAQVVQAELAQEALELVLRQEPELRRRGE